MMLKHIDGIIFDLDGTIYLGEAPLPGAVETIAELRRRGKRLLFVSNKPLENRQTYAKKLTGMGIPASPEEVITSAYVMGDYLARTWPDLKLYVIGEDNLRAELRQHGLHLVDEYSDQDAFEVINPDGIDAVVVAFDRTLDYRKLNTAYQALRHGARFFATNADKACPMPNGSIPDAGATIASLEYLTGRELELLAGKPSPLILQSAIQYLDLPAERCLMVGDRLETDIRMGQRAGMQTALVLTGATRIEEVDGFPDRPDCILQQLSELLEWIE
jgi:arabinose operon protein AraL